MARSLAGSRFSTESAHGASIMGSEDEVEQSLGRPCPAAGPGGLTNSPHPSSREGHHSTAWWSSGFLLLLISLGADNRQYARKIRVYERSPKSANDHFAGRKSL